MTNGMYLATLREIKELEKMGEKYRRDGLTKYISDELGRLRGLCADYKLEKEKKDIDDKHRRQASKSCPGESQDIL